jgi:polar amino acid transport system permease protein
MDIEPSHQIIEIPSIEDQDNLTFADRIRNFPWWFAGIIGILIATYLLIFFNPNFRDAFLFIITGLWVTVSISLISYAIALVLGLLSGMGRISRNFVFRNIATFYIELIRGVPMLVLIFFIAFVLVPGAITAIQQFGIFLENAGLESIGGVFASLDPRSFSFYWRAVIALSLTYGAFLAEIFRAGIESIEKGQMEAARSLGMSYGNSMRYVILPQAIRNVLPALANDFVAMVKDSSLVSVLAVRDITQIARLYAGRSFRFKEAYSVLTVLYLTLTVILSLSIRFVERRMRRDAR